MNTLLFIQIKGYKLLLIKLYEFDLNKQILDTNQLGMILIEDIHKINIKPYLHLIIKQINKIYKFDFRTALMSLKFQFYLFEINYKFFLIIILQLVN